MTTGFGAFGKLPSMGDFLRHNLPAGFMQPWDTWLQEGMLSVRALLEDNWTDAYMSAPIWRFTLPAGQLGKDATSGIMMASVDRVGRQYPLTLVASHDDNATAFAHFANRTVFEQLEDIALAALDEDATRDSLVDALAEVNFVRSTPTTYSGAPYVGSLPAAQVIAAETITQQHGNAALWSAMMEGDHRLVVTSGLPEGRALRGLFDLNSPYWQSREPVLSL